MHVNKARLIACSGLIASAYFVIHVTEARRLKPSGREQGAPLSQKQIMDRSEALLPALDLPPGEVVLRFRRNSDPKRRSSTVVVETQESVYRAHINWDTNSGRIWDIGIRSHKLPLARPLGSAEVVARSRNLVVAACAGEGDVKLISAAPAQDDMWSVRWRVGGGAALIQINGRTSDIRHFEFVDADTGI